MDSWSSTLRIDDEFEKLVIRMNPPRVTVDNASDSKATLIKVDSANKRGSLLEVVQVLSDLNLIIKRAYISSDGGWFMDVFYVTDELGNKVYDDNVSDQIQQSFRNSFNGNDMVKVLDTKQLNNSVKEKYRKKNLIEEINNLSLGPRGRSFRSLEQSVGVHSAVKHTAIELSGRDRPGLLSEVSAVLTDLKCNIVATELWTHNSRMASVVYITDESTGFAIDDPDRLANIKQLLLYVLKGNREWKCANTAVSVGSTHTQRRLHQIMYADRDYDNENVDAATTVRTKPLVTVENCIEKGYTMVNVRCQDRPKLLFDTVCTITDMQYVIFHGTISSEEAEAHQEYYIRHMDGCPVNSEAERQRVIHCLEAAIKRRAPEGVRLELCSEDRVGLLSDVTRIFRENGLSVVRAEVTTRGKQAVNVFYVTDASGQQVRSETIEAVRKEIGLTVLQVKDDAHSSSPRQQTSRRFSLLGNLFRSRSEKLLSNLGLTKSSSCHE